MSGSGAIVASVPASGRAAAAREIAALPHGPDPIELRADRLGVEDVGALVAGAERELIVTVRRREDGGAFEGDEAQRRRMLLAALTAGARWIDVESGGALAVLADGPEASRVILSDHDAVCEREDLEERVERLARSPAARLKLVARAERPAQVLAIRDVLRGRADRRLCAFAAGESGALSRVLALAWGSWGTYAAVRRGAQTARGQFTVEELSALYGVKRIGASTQIVALAGSDVLPASPSPAMHNAGYRALGLDRVYVALQTDEWSDVVTLADGLGMDGLAVTMPFKSVAADHATTLDAPATNARAVNTIVFRPDGIVGANTDGPAAIECLEGHGLATTDRIDVLGAGGTGRAIAAALASAGYRPRLWSRGTQRREPLPAGVEHGVLERRDAGEAAWLVNATPLRNDALFEPDAPAAKGVLDVVYGGPPTALVRAARRAGIVAIDGFDLLVAQAERQFRLHTGVEPPYRLFAAVGQRYLAALG